MDANTTQILTLLIAALSSGFGVWIALQNRRLERQGAQIHKDVNVVKDEVIVVKELANGHNDLLLAATKVGSEAVGKAAGVEQERARTEADLSSHAVEPNDKGHH